MQGAGARELSEGKNKEEAVFLLQYIFTEFLLCLIKLSFPRASF